MRANDYLKDILGTTTKIAAWVKIIAIMLFAFCVWMCIHYLLLHFRDADLASLPFDYNGMIVGFLTILVTLLVGWNIGSAINAKADIDEWRRKSESVSRLEARLDALEKTLNANIEGERRRCDNPTSININLPQSVMEYVHRDIAKHGTNLWGWLWRVVDETKSDAEILAEYNKVATDKPKSVEFINHRLATEAEVLSLIDEMRKIKPPKSK